MENFRLFLIRLLQVVWMLTICMTIFAFFIENFSVDSASAVLFVFGIPSLVVQYLVFASVNPISLFNGRLKENLTP